MSRLLIALAMLAAIAPMAMATTWHVPSECPTIQAGIDSAAVGDTVLVECGTYYEYDILMKSGVCLTSEAGQPDCVTIDAQGLGRGFYCDGIEPTTRLVGVTITGGSASGEWWPECAGGGLYMASSSLSLENVVLAVNSARDGGGLCCLDSSQLSLIDVEFTGNTASSAGGGLQCRFSSASLQHVALTANSAGSGGGVYSDGSSITLVDVVMLDNAAWGASGSGGGIMCDGPSPEFISMTDCVISGNSAHYGGGMYVPHGDNSFVADCAFLGNTAVLGGGLYCCVGSPCLERTAFSGNSATLGGGVYCWGEGNSPLFVDCLFRENSAVEAGGGMLAKFTCQPQLTGCTFSGNQAPDGSALSSENTSCPSMVSTVIAFGLVGEAVYCDGGSAVTVTCSNIYGNTGGDWVGCIADQYGINGNFSADPMFCDPDNGNFMLDVTSPCAPDNNSCGVLIGAYPVGCGASPVEATSWGRVKAMYR